MILVYDRDLCHRDGLVRRSLAFLGRFLILSGFAFGLGARPILLAKWAAPGFLAGARGVGALALGALGRGLGIGALAAAVARGAPAGVGLGVETE